MTAALPAGRGAVDYRREKEMRGAASDRRGA